MKLGVPNTSYVDQFQALASSLDGFLRTSHYISHEARSSRHQLCRSVPGTRFFTWMASLEHHITLVMKLGVPDTSYVDQFQALASSPGGFLRTSHYISHEARSSRHQLCRSVPGTRFFTWMASLEHHITLVMKLGVPDTSYVDQFQALASSPGWLP